MQARALKKESLSVRTGIGSREQTGKQRSSTVCKIYDTRERPGSKTERPCNLETAGKTAK